MIDLDAVVYTYVCGVMLTVSVLGLESALTTNSLQRWDKRFFTVFFAVLVATSASYFLELVAYVQPTMVVLKVLAYYIQLLLGTAPFVMLTIYLLRYCEEDWRRSPLFRAVATLWGVYLILLNVAQFTNVFYYIAPDGKDHIGNAYPLLLAPILAILLLMVAGVIRRWDKLASQYQRAFLISVFPITIAVGVHMFVPNYLAVDITLTLCAYSMYRIVESSSIEQSMRDQREIASQRANIAVLQMRPHFIYNTMTSIYYLCDQDPGLAKQVTLDFTTYLRKNLTAIASEDTIPFSEELEHTRAYLAVEQAQFEDDLLVCYDTPHTLFRLPPLTLQPIVENAVKHGMDPDSEPLHINIRTREADSGSEIIVEDDGPGFEPKADDEPHIALKNIEHRLDMTCGGRLTISSREGGGTVVRVTIPSGT